jgi:hypothetical protein
MPHDAEEVLKIRLPAFNTEDFISWPSESNGIFSVRSAYRLALDDRISINTNSSHSSNGDINFGIPFEKLTYHQS